MVLGNGGGGFSSNMGFPSSSSSTTTSIPGNSRILYNHLRSPLPNNNNVSSYNNYSNHHQKGSSMKVSTILTTDFDAAPRANFSVRFGRVPKREKAKILAAMQKVNQSCQEKHLSEQLEDEAHLLAAILQAHDETCDYTKEKVAPLVERARSQPIYAHCPPQMACPLNPMPAHVMEAGGASRILEDFSERFSPAIRGVVEFAKRIPGFGMLSQDDQVTLLKAGVFEVLLVRLACMFDSESNSMICLNGLVLRRESLHSASNARFLLDSMFDFAERLNSLGLSDHEIGLFCAVVVIAPDRPGLRNVELVQKINRKLEEMLQRKILEGHPGEAGLFSELNKKIPDLRTLNTLHSEKLLAYKMEPKNTTGMGNGESGSINGHADSSAPSPCNYASLVQWQQLALLGGGGGGGISSPGSSSPRGSDWSDSKDCDGPGSGGSYGSPRSVGSSIMSTDEGMHKSPPRPPSAASAKSAFSTSGPSENGNPGPVTQPSVLTCPPGPSDPNRYSPSEQMAQFHLGSGTRRPSGGILLSVNGHSDVHDEAVRTGPGQAPVFGKLKRVDSPTDSGIDSGKEHGNTPNTSVCSSPRSAMDDKVKDLTSDSEGSEGKGNQGESIDDMPMLKRALQAPPLINTNMLMDEAYRHHKKFRATKREALGSASSEPPQSPSTTTGSSSSSVVVGGTHVQSLHSSEGTHHHPTLASSHSTLVRTLAEAPRYLSEQQLKRTDLIHNIIMKTEMAPGREWKGANPANGPTSIYYNGTGGGPSAYSKSSSGPGVVVCPPGYYIPPYQNGSTGCPYGGGSRGGQARVMYAVNGESGNGSSSGPAPSPLGLTNGYHGGVAGGPAPSPLVIRRTPSPNKSARPLPLAGSMAPSPLMSSTSSNGDSMPLNLSKKASPSTSPAPIDTKMSDITR